jgi:hypothetical protein
MISLLLCLDLFFGGFLRRWRRCNLKDIKLPLLAIQRLGEVLWRLLDIFNDGGEKFLTMSLRKRLAILKEG